LRTLNCDLAAASRKWLGNFMTAGEVASLPMTLVAAIVTGPAHAIAQRWLAGQIRGPLVSYADDLVDAAVAGLGTSPTPRRRRTRRPPAEGHIRVQLVADDGTILAEGHAVAELTSVATRQTVS